MDQHDNRSVITGQFVTDEEAEKHPDVTIRETRPEPDPRAHEDLAALCKDAFYAARDNGRTMHQAADDAADAIIAAGFHR